MTKRYEEYLRKKAKEGDWSARFQLEQEGIFDFLEEPENPKTRPTLESYRIRSDGSREVVGQG
jgi:hypothetical protein